MLLVHHEDIKVNTTPFRHWTNSIFLPIDLSYKLLEWYKTTDEWRFRRIAGFYDTYDIPMLSVELPKSIESLICSETLHELREIISNTFDVTISDKVDVMANRMSRDFRMGIHNDFGPHGQAYRIVVQINDGWTKERGGLLMLFDQENPNNISDQHRYYAPRHGSVCAFEISNRSFHAVSPVISGERYSIVYSFYLT